MTTFSVTTSNLLKVSTQQIKSDGQHVQGQIFEHNLSSTDRKHSVGKNTPQTESQQLPAGLFRVSARLWSPINVPSSDNICKKKKKKGPVAWEIRARVSVSERERLVFKRGSILAEAF